MSSRTLVLAAWALLAASALACGVLPLLTRRRFATLFELTRRLTRTRAALAGFFLGWLWLGWHFFAR